VLGQHKVGEHFEVGITDTSLTVTRFSLDSRTANSTPTLRLTVWIRGRPQGRRRSRSPSDLPGESTPPRHERRSWRGACRGLG
jgi:hypothetical protein